MEPTIDTDETIDRSNYFLKGNEGDEKMGKGKQKGGRKEGNREESHGGGDPAEDRHCPVPGLPGARVTHRKFLPGSGRHSPTHQPLQVLLRPTPPLAGCRVPARGARGRECPVHSGRKLLLAPHLRQ